MLASSAGNFSTTLPASLNTALPASSPGNFSAMLPASSVGNFPYHHFLCSCQLSPSGFIPASDIPTSLAGFAALSGLSASSLGCTTSYTSLASSAWKAFCCHDHSSCQSVPTGFAALSTSKWPLSLVGTPDVADTGNEFSPLVAPHRHDYVDHQPAGFLAPSSLLEASLVSLICLRFLSHQIVMPRLQQIVSNAQELYQRAF